MLRELKIIKKNHVTQQRDKPKIYLKVDEEILRSKLLLYFRNKHTHKLIKKYFNNLKLNYKFIKLFKIHKFKNKISAYNILKENYLLLRYKHTSIIEYFIKLKKLKFFMSWYKYTSRQNNIRALKDYHNQKKLKIYVYEIKRSIYYKHDTLMKTCILYFRIISNKFHNYINKISIHRKKISMFRRNTINKAKQDLLVKLIGKCYLNAHKYSYRNLFFKTIFFNRVRYILKEKFNYIKSIEYFKIRMIRLLFIKRIQNILNVKRKNVICFNYRIDYIKQIFLYVIKRNFENLQKIKKLLKDYVILKRLKKLKYTHKIINQNKEEIKRIRKTYKSHKSYKIMKNKKLFFYLIKCRNEYKHIISIAISYEKEVLIRKAFSILKRNYIKNKFYLNFLKIFRNIYNNTILEQYLKLMQNKTCFVDHNVVDYYLDKKYDKYSEILHKFRIRSKVKKFKKHIKAVKIYIRKEKLSLYFYKKKLLIKAFYSLNILKKYIQIKKNYHNKITSNTFDKVIYIKELKKRISKLYKIRNDYSMIEFVKKYYIVLSIYTDRLNNKSLSKLLKFNNNRKCNLLLILYKMYLSVLKRFFINFITKYVHNKYKSMLLRDSFRIIYDIYKNHMNLKQKLTLIKQDCMYN